MELFIEKANISDYNWNKIGNNYTNIANAMFDLETQRDLMDNNEILRLHFSDANTELNNLYPSGSKVICYLRLDNNTTLVKNSFEATINKFIKSNIPPGSRKDGTYEQNKNSARTNIINQLENLLTS